ncbi:hypothetical protein AKJ52_00250 [candidate division MSBL1 archaeon SCGC-AAA382C18]|uniref:NADH dehydrogenase n=1 Tax=candidate division MSBL1 archaeon SCGC-AAA382C18 TaxID=1698281 RepID=A0A133VLS3_9EURY|nr:hypothetical protein AKJ52_00250 [candidate division MSBL1 archaeon SCGC-AAA382C18]
MEITAILWDIFYFAVFPGIIFSFIVGQFYEGLDRKIAAHLQHRIGPPVWQPFLDVGKLFTKEDITPANAQSGLFNFSPYLGFGAIIAVMLMIPVYAASAAFSASADLIVIIYLLNIPAVAIMLAGVSSSTPFGAVGTERYIVQLFAFEFPFIIAALTVAVYVGDFSGGGWVLSLKNIVGAQQGLFGFAENGWLLWKLPLAAVAMLLVAPAKLLKTPFDIPEAETEIVYGPLTEYSGPKLALFKVMENIKLVAVAGFITALFLGGPTTHILFGYSIPAIVDFLLKTVSILILITVIRSVTARLRIHQAVKFYWTFVAILAIINLGYVMVF